MTMENTVELERDLLSRLRLDAAEGEQRSINTLAVLAARDAEIVSLREQITELTKQRDHHASTIFSAQIASLKSRLRGDMERRAELLDQYATLIRSTGGVYPWPGFVDLWMVRVVEYLRDTDILSEPAVSE